MTGGADISLARNDQHYTAQVAVEKVGFPKPDRSLFQIQNSAGGAQRHTSISVGSAPTSAPCTASGKVEVTDGNVFAIPVFGPLSDLVNKMFAGVGYSVAHEATAPFTIKDGVIHTDKLKVSGKLFAMLGHGDINFLRNNLDFDIRIDVGWAGRGPDAALQAFRIPRRRQPDETGLASEKVLRNCSADC